MCFPSGPTCARVGASTVWSQVTTNAVGNPAITNVIALRGSYGCLIALRSDNTLWTWGELTYLGNNTAVLARNRATPMTLPGGATVKMFGATHYDATTAVSYYMLATSGNLYALGANSVRQLGDWTTTNRTGWVQPRYTSAAGPVMNNIAWISPQEHSSVLGCINVINTAGTLYAWGSNDGNMLSGTTDPMDPTIPAGSSGNRVLAVETGGHTSMITQECRPNYGYVGHRTAGSMGDGTATNTNELSYTFATAPVQICGAGSVPALTVLSTTVLGGNYCSNGSATIVPNITGGTFTLVSGPGTLSLSGGNAIVTFTGVGAVQVNYTVTDVCGTTSTSTTLNSLACSDLAITKTTNTNSPAIGGPITFTLQVTNNGSSNATNVVAVDALPAGYTLVSATPSSGTWSAPNWTIGNLNNGSTVSMTIVATVNVAGPYGNTATVSATQLDIDASNNTSTVTPSPIANVAPVANDDTGAGLTEDGTNGTVNILSNDVDANGNPTAPTNGAGLFTVDLDLGTAGLQTSLTNATGDWTYNTATGVVTFDPANNYNGTATISYQLCDPGALCDPATISFTVSPVNDPPVANDDTGAALSEDGANGTISILGNDTDVDGNPPAGGPTNGAGQFTVDLDLGTAGLQTTLTNATGVWTYNAATGVVTFDPANNYNGTATIAYQLCDPGAACDPASITFVVDPVNDPPVANDDSGASVAEDGANGTVNIITNDTDVDGNPTAPTNGAGQFTVDLDLGTAGLQTSLTNAAGVWTYNTATGVVTFDPANDYNGTAVITYQLCDPGAACDPATITFVVTSVNDTPVANDDNGGSLTEDGANGTVSILSNDTDVDGNPTAPTNGAGQFTIDLDLGTAGLQTTLTNATGVWTYNTATGVVTFDPANNYNGTATIAYQLCDPAAACDPANITFTVTPVNDPPVANDDTGTSVAEDGANSAVSILTNDTDNDGNPTAPTNGAGQFTVDLDISTAGIQTSLHECHGRMDVQHSNGRSHLRPGEQLQRYGRHHLRTLRSCDQLRSSHDHGGGHLGERHARCER